jgi:hypothetical protein
VTDSSNPGVVHTQKLITDVTEMMDQKNSDANAKHGVTETLNESEVSDSQYDMSQYLNPTQAAPNFKNQNQAAPQSHNVAVGQNCLLVQPQGQILQGQTNQGHTLGSPSHKPQEPAILGQPQGY